MDFLATPIKSARVDWQDDTLWAPDYQDGYFMRGSDREESRVVFIEGCDLPARFATLPDDGLFVIGETGFGTGLNLLLATRCFLDRAPATARLSLLSAERHPLKPADLRLALARWPELDSISTALLAGWPPAAAGFHRIALHERVDLTLMFGDADTMWAHGPDGVDAWFLDGFAPARNPSMWSPALLRTLARRSRPGASLATFTAAGHVRRGLSEAGFKVERRPGFGGKRHRLTAHAPGQWQAQRLRRGRALIVGAGLAGATTARALAERGWRITLIDPILDRMQNDSPLRAVLHTSASHRLDARYRFHLTAFVLALHWLKRYHFPAHDREGRLEGIVQHLAEPRMARRTRQAIATGSWPASLLSALDAHSVEFHGAGFLDPVTWCRRLIGHPAIDRLSTEVTALGQRPGPWLSLANKARLEGDAVVLCSAAGTARLPGLEWLPLRVVRGQVSFCQATADSAQWQQARCHSGYVTPATNGVHCVGASFDRQRSEALIDPNDDRINLAGLKRHLPQAWKELGGHDIRIIGQHAGLRCQTADALPVVGALPDSPGFHLNIAHGSRGLTHTPLCAELLADRMTGLPAPADQAVIEALRPQRLIRPTLR